MISTRPSSRLVMLCLFALAACARAGTPAPVEYRGVGAGETRPGSAGTYSSPAPDSSYSGPSGTYTPPAGYGSTSSGVQMQELPPPGNSPASISSSSVSSVPVSGGEPNDAYAQAANRPLPPASTPSVSPTLEGNSGAIASPPPSTGSSIPPASSSVLGSGEYGWPLRGRLLSGYGPKPGGQANDGLNIAALQGTPVYVSRDGTVAYAGNELRSFGNMVLIRHSGGMFTVYAHLDRILVSKDQEVTKGLPLGTVGQTGGVSEPQLHFEVRRGSTPLDPTGYLGR